MGTLYLLDDTDKLPFVSAPTQSEAYTVWVLNPNSLEDAIFGPFKKPKGVLPHDHAERRGVGLWEPFWFCQFGPQGPEGGAANAWIQGLPLYPPSSTNDFTTNPKCLGWWPFRVPAGVKAFWLETLFYLDGAAPRTVTLKARLRTLGELGLNHDKGIAPSSTLTTTQAAGVARVTRAHFDFSDLAALGDLGMDKDDLLLEIWLMSNAPAGRLYRLLSSAAVAKTNGYGTGTGEPIESAPERAEVSPSEILTGQNLYSEIAQRAHLRYNQINLEGLGRSPGYEPNLGTENEGDSFQTELRAPHSHRGRRYIDPVSGLPVYDGAVTRRLLWLCAPIVALGDTAADLDSTPGQGLKIHSGGSLATQVELRGRCSMPIGQQALFFSFGLKPGTALELTRCYLYLALEDIEGNAIEISVNTQGVTSQSAKSGAFTIVDVLPNDSPLWQNTNTRINTGLGVWTEDALKNPYPSSAIDGGRIPRASRRITVSFALSKVDYPYVLKAKWALETGVRGSGTLASNARLAYAVASVPAGF